MPRFLLRIMGPHLLLVLGLAICLLAGPTLSWAASPAMARLLEQLDQKVLKPKGYTIMDLLAEDPGFGAALLGLGLRSQMPYVQKNPQLQQEFNQLRRDVTELVGILARNLVSVDQYGQPVTEKVLLECVNAAMEGRDDVEKAMRAVLGVDPRLPTMPLVLGRKGPR